MTEQSKINNLYLGKWSFKWSAIKGIIPYFNNITEEVIDVRRFIGVMYYSKTISNLSVLQKGVEDILETAVNRTVDISNQVLLLISILIMIMVHIRGCILN